MKRVFAGDTPHEDEERSGPRWETAIGRVNAVAEITRGHSRCIQGRTLVQQVRILQGRREAALAEARESLQAAGSEKEREEAQRELARVDRLNPAPSIQVLSSWRKALLAGGLGVQALLDCDRGGKGGFRLKKKMSAEELKAHIRACEPFLIQNTGKPYPRIGLLRGAILGRVGKERAHLIPSERTLDKFRCTVFSRAERIYMARGERGYLAECAAKPTAHYAKAHGEMVVYDHRQVDNEVLYQGRLIRPWVTAGEDPVSGAARGLIGCPIHPSSTEVGLCIWDSIRMKPEDPEKLLCGLFKWFYSDMGRDLRGIQIQAALEDTDIKGITAKGYSPWTRPVEGNLFKTMAVQFDPSVPGYVGNNAQAKPPMKTEPVAYEKWWAAVRHWTLVTFNNLVYQRRLLDGQKASRLDFARANRTPVELPRDDTLRLALLKRERRTVSPNGISLGGMFIYWSDELYPLAEERASVEIRWDPSSMSEIEVFYRGEWYCTAYDAHAASAQATEQDMKNRHRLRAQRAKHLREATRPEREAAMSGEAHLEFLRSQRAAEVRVIAAGGTRQVIPRMIPRLDRAAARIKGGGHPGVGGNLPGRRLRESDLLDPYDKPLPEERER